MPCYDKKLEASRKDFYSEIHYTRDVDCVLTTGELEIMMQEKGWDLSNPVPGEDLDEDFYYQDDCTAIPELVQHQGTSSGSYLHSLIAALSTPSTILSSKTIRTSDYEEFVLKDTNTGEIILKGAKCYGFRNLQNVVRKVGKDAGVRTGRGAAGGRLGGVVKGRRAGAASANTEESKGYDYVEVMACPSGCVNGGGQIRPPATSKLNWSGATTPTTPADLDNEGFQRDWSMEGVATPVSFASSASSSLEPAGLSAKWGDKAWTARVEAAYWSKDDRDLPTPPDSPSEGTGGGVIPLRQLKADKRALDVVNDLCRPTQPLRSWLDRMTDAVSETRRREFFRTQYRPVESEVVGLTVQW